MNILSNTVDRQTDRQTDYHLVKNKVQKYKC